MCQLVCASIIQEKDIGENSETTAFQSSCLAASSACLLTVDTNKWSIHQLKVFKCGQMKLQQPYRTVLTAQTGKCSDTPPLRSTKHQSLGITSCVRNNSSVFKTASKVQNPYKSFYFHTCKGCGNTAYSIPDQNMLKHVSNLLLLYRK